MMTIKIVIIDDNGISCGSSLPGPREAAEYVRMNTGPSLDKRGFMGLEKICRAGMAGPVGANPDQEPAQVIPKRKRSLWERLIGKHV